MAFFRKNQDDDRIKVGDDDLKRAGIVLIRWEEALGTTDAALRAAVLAIAQAGGHRGFRDSSDINLPWRWLLSVARLAADNGSWLLASRVCFFPLFWNHSMVPELDARDFLEMGIGSTPRPLQRDIAVLAMDCMGELSETQVVVQNPTGTFHVAEAQVLAALTLVGLTQAGVAVDPAVLARARTIIG